MTKTCYKCQTLKPLHEFNKCKNGTFGVHGHCRECQQKIRKSYYDQKQKPTKYWLNDHEKETRRQWANKKYHSDSKWRETHKRRNNIRRSGENAKIKARLQRCRWYSIPKNRIACSLRCRLRKAIKLGIKIDTTETLLGCSFEQAKTHLETQFQPGMTWENYGQWHIDHIIPCSFFDLTDVHQQRICFNYQNLQPMWAKENISKNNKLSVDRISKILEKLKAIT